VKRGKPLPRGTKGLVRTAGLSRGTGLNRAERKRRPARDTGPSRAVRAAVWSREDGACAACGTGLAGRLYSVQHRVARGIGGTSDPAANTLPNLILLCGDAVTGCHGLAETRDPVMRERGFWIYSWENPALVPVVLASGAMVWLGDDGAYLTEPPETEEAGAA